MALFDTYEDRIAYIKSIAERQARMRKLAARGRVLSTYVNEVEEPARKRQKNLTEQYDGGTPDFHYTDASKYAEKYYGDVYRQTTRLDNEWD